MATWEDVRRLALALPETSERRSRDLLQWRVAGQWSHRAFWGENLIQWGEYGTSDRLDMGALPPTGQWVQLSVPASALQLEGAVLQGMCFMLYDGRATWDSAGRASGGSPSP